MSAEGRVSNSETETPTSALTSSKVGDRRSAREVEQKVLLVVHRWGEKDSQ